MSKNFHYENLYSPLVEYFLVTCRYHSFICRCVFICILICFTFTHSKKDGQETQGINNSTSIISATEGGAR